MDNDAACMLRGIRVLDMADDSLGLCGRLLADLGASVVVERGRKDTALGERLREADVLIENENDTHFESSRLKREESLRIHPRLIHLSISPFGRTGPKRHYRSSATVLSAAGGEMFFCRDGGNKPSVLYGAQPYLLASLFGAVAVLILLIKRRITGKGSFIDLSIQEAVASAMYYVPGERLSRNGESNGEEKNLPPETDFPVLPCRDGYIQLALAGNWQTLAEILATETEASELSGKQWMEPEHRRTHSVLLMEILENWTRKHTKKQLFELGQAMAFPWAPVCDLREVMESPQLAFRGFFTREPAKFGEPERIYPGRPYRFLFPRASLASSPSLEQGNKASISEHHGRSEEYASITSQSAPPLSDCPSGEVLKAIRVLDLTRMLSGPFCTRTLADFGAEVIKIQTRKTSTGAERNDTPYFAAWNRNKRSITLDLSTAEARALFLKLVSTSDIVVENYSPRVMANWGLSYERLKEANPSIVMLSLSAMGQTGPWKDYVGFAPTFHALSGLLSSSSGTPEKGPLRIGYAHADIVAGLYGIVSVLAAVRRKERTGQGCHIDLSCYESMCAFLSPGQARKEADGHEDKSRPSEEPCPVFFPDMCYPCREENSWCALTIESEAGWKELCKIVLDPELYSERFLSDAARLQNREDLNARICEWTSLRSAPLVEKTLQEVGIAAYAVQGGEDLMRDPQLKARHHFMPMIHPVLGTMTVDRTALWPGLEDGSGWRPAPSIGEANHDIFVGLLGMPETTFDEYVRRGIIG